jgi:adenylate cyclase
MRKEVFRKRFLVIVLLAIFILPVFAQKGGSEIDSLTAVLEKTKEDTTRVDVLLKIAAKKIDLDPQGALAYISEAITIAEQLNDKPRMAAAYNNLGSYYNNSSDFPKSLEAYFKSLRINEELGNKIAVARNSGNIGNVYRSAGDFHKAIEYFEKAFAINKELDRGIGMTNNLSDMGIAWSELKQNAKAYESFNRALQIAEEKDDREGVAIILGNIANLNRIENKFKEAIDHFNRSLKINEELGRTPGIATNKVNLAELYLLTALDTTGAHAGLLRSLGGKEKTLNLAENFFLQAIDLFKMLGALHQLSASYNGLAGTYEAMGDYKKAFEMSSQYHLLKDSVFSIDNRVMFSNQSKERAELEKKQQEELTTLTQSKRRNEAILFSVCIALLLVFTGFVIRERKRSEKLLLNILPAKVASELKRKGSSDAKHFTHVTVMFTDFVGFTTAAEKMTPQQLVDELHTCFKNFDEIISKYNIEKIKTIGDAYLAVSGLPNASPQHAENVVKAALEIRDFMQARHRQASDRSFHMRIGIHSGSVVAGIVGVKKFAYDIWGDTVNTAARMEQNSEPCKINISEATFGLVKDKFACSYRGEISAKNKGHLKMYFVERQ